MGCRNREFTDDETVSSSSLSEALLFATMCIIGLPVDVHVKDGSVYSGIFYTASVENEYGIVLKKAILSGDLVQVVAKGVLLPAADVAGNMAGDETEAVAGTIPSDVCIKNDAKKPIESAINKKKLNGVRGPMQNGNGLAHGVTSTGPGKEHEGRNLPPKHGGNTMEVEHGKGEGMNLSECKMLLQADKVNDKKMTSKRLPSGVSCDPVTVIINSDNQCCERTTSADISSDVVSSGVSTLFNPAADASCRRLVATSTEMVPPQGPEFNRSAKEFKLNPGAKTFSPSFTKPITSTPPSVPTVVSMGYIPNNSPVVAVPAAQPEVGSNPFPSRSSVPVKVVPYNNFTNGHGGSGSQFSQPIVGHMGSRVQTLRYPVQAGPTYVHPNSQAVMVGRFGQVVYMHPVSQDLVQGATAMSPLPARPVLTPHQVQFPKHQGPAAAQAFQLCVPPPFMATGQQPFPIAKTHPLFATSLPF
ncbi:PREDICTED: uncharacterized protein LOC103326469 [Prunus mume]|uniref:Uncharacterized protein LOC103326469 n=1 Tax=Prunus mume TaxID=102107 RepID=A0ABM0NMB0_PRUMU|nr:PREDICTED: uncharacterized protein LOC103326469 [Prunus mume]